MRSKGCLCILLLFCLFSFLSSTPLSDQPLEIEEKEEKHRQIVGFRYDLDNECTDILQHPIVVPGRRQDDIFDDIALTVSDYRMFPPECRRSIIWLLCNLAFPTATPTCGIVGGPQCDFVMKKCPGEFQESFDMFNCSGLSKERRERRMGWKEGGGGGEEGERGGGEGWEGEEEGGVVVRQEVDFSCVGIEEASEEPNSVVTCLFDPNTTTPCCFNPFVMSDITDECVFACPLSRSGYDEDRAQGITLITFAWVGTFVAFISFLPMCFMEGFLVFPKYLLPLIVLVLLLFLHVISWPVYDGFENTVCVSGGQGYLADAELYLDSAKCKAQFFFVNLFVVVFPILLLIFSMVFFFVTLPPRIQGEGGKGEKIAKVLRVGALPLAFGIGLAIASVMSLLDAYSDEEVKTIGLIYSCTATLPDLPGSLPFVVGAFCCGVSLLFLLAGVVSLSRRSWRMLMVQWRSMVFIGMMVFLVLCMSIQVFVFIPLDDYEGRVADSGTCVAFPPNSRDPEMAAEVCPSVNSKYFGYEMFFVVILSSWPVMVCVILYLSESVTWMWWKVVILERKFARTGSDLTSGLGVRESTKSQRFSGDETGGGVGQQTSSVPIEPVIGMSFERNHDDIPVGGPPTSHYTNSSPTQNRLAPPPLNSRRHSHRGSPRRGRAGSFLPERTEDEKRERRGSYQPPSPRRVPQKVENSEGEDDAWKLDYKPMEGKSTRGGSPSRKRPF